MYKTRNDNSDLSTGAQSDCSVGRQARRASFGAFAPSTVLLVAVWWWILPFLARDLVTGYIVQCRKLYYIAVLSSLVIAAIVLAVELLFSAWARASCKEKYWQTTLWYYAVSALFLFNLLGLESVWQFRSYPGYIPDATFGMLFCPTCFLYTAVAFVVSLVKK